MLSACKFFCMVLLVGCLVTFHKSAVYYYNHDIPYVYDNNIM